MGSPIDALKFVIFSEKYCLRPYSYRPVSIRKVYVRCLIFWVKMDASGDFVVFWNILKPGVCNVSFVWVHYSDGLR